MRVNSVSSSSAGSAGYELRTRARKLRQLLFDEQAHLPPEAGDIKPPGVGADMDRREARLQRLEPVDRLQQRIGRLLGEEDTGRGLRGERLAGETAGSG